MSDLNITSALNKKEPILSDISITEVENLGMIDLRGDLGDKKFVNAVKKVLGCALPSKPRTSSQSKTATCLWLSPDQWLITCPKDQVSTLLQSLNDALAGIHSLCVDVSDMRSVIRLDGNGAKEILMKGSSVDLTLAECSGGFVRRALFAEQAALFHIVSDKPTCIDLYVFRSYAAYVWNWLEVTSKPGGRVLLFGKQDQFET